MLHKIFIILFLLGISGFTYTNDNTGFTFPEETNSIQIPIETVHNLIIVPVIINDGPVLNFILDTGVKNTILTAPVVARALDLESDETVHILGLGNEGVIEALKIEDVTVHIDDIKGENIEILAIPDNVLLLSEIFGFPVHGIIGYELFKDFPVFVNYLSDYIVVYKDDNYPIRRNSYTIPLEIRDGKPYITTKINTSSDTTVDIPLLIDLGASHALYLNDNYKHLAKDTTITTYLGKGIGGDMLGEEGRIDKFKLSDDLVFNNAIAAFPNPEQVWLNQYNIEWDGLIGGAILNRFHLLIDYSSKKLILNKNANFRKPFRSNMSGLEIIAKGVYHDEYIINHVRRGSAAYEAGIIEGDIIQRINNRNADNISLQDILNELNSPPDTRISMEVTREYQISENDEEEENEETVETIIKSHYFVFFLREDI